MFGVSTSPPKLDSWPYPTSSSTKKSTFGAPSRARVGAGQAGLDSSTVRPISPGNWLPGRYSSMPLISLLAPLSTAT
jgi:hypothetical protein